MVSLDRTERERSGRGDRHRRVAARPTRRQIAPSPRFTIFALFLALCTLGGGSSKVWVPSLLYLRPAAVACIGALAITAGPFDFRRYRMPFLILGLLAAAIAIQLVPLPPGWFAALPGHQPFARIAVLEGSAPVWRPISLTPDLTLNSLLALLPALSVLVAFASFDDRDRHLSGHALSAVALLSMVMAMAQLAQGPGSPAYLYAQTSPTLPVGLFANRNHQATLLAMALPAFATSAIMLTQRYGRTTIVPVAAGALIVAAILLALLTGSRSGLVVTCIGMPAAALLAGSAMRGRSSRPYFMLGIAALLVVAIGSAIALGRATTVDRVTAGGDVMGDMRILALPVLLQLIRTYLPFGSGFGSFDPVFRNVEPDALLHAVFFNNAHDDYLELAITGGLPALAVLALAIVWFVWRGWTLVGQHDAERALPTLLARLGWLGLFLLSLASISDYPVRTPLFAAIVAISAAWLCPMRGQRSASERLQ